MAKDIFERADEISMLGSESARLELMRREIATEVADLMREGIRQALTAAAEARPKPRLHHWHMVVHRGPDRLIETIDVIPMQDADPLKERQ
jgi:hypothetical protein